MKIKLLTSIFLVMILTLTVNVEQCIIVVNSDSVKEVQNLINDLGDVTLDSKTQIDEIEEKYNLLTDDEKAKVKNYSTYETKKNEYNDLYQRSIHPSLNLIDEINEIPYPLEFTTEEKAGIDKIVEEYNNLSADEKALVSNYSMLQSVLQEYQDHENELTIQKLKAECQEINELIKTIPSTLTYSESERKLIEDIKTAYSNLSTQAKPYVENYNLVSQAEKAIQKYDEEQAILKLIEACKEVNELIKTIPDTLTYSTTEKATIDSIVSKYNQLTTEEKKYVENYEVVTNAVASYTEHEILEKVTPINESIQALSDLSSITLNDETKINNIKKSYEALTSKEKEYVKNYKYVTQALSRIELLKQAQIIIDAINTLPTTITLNDEAKINTVKKSYDDASTNVKSLVTNYETLQTAYNKLCQLKQGSNPYRVYFNTNGGEVAGLQEESQAGLTEVASVNINYFNNGFWDVYKTECVLYDQATIVADTGSTYAFNLKIGFSYNNTKKQYIVNQLIPSGTGFTTETRAGSDYFIICNGENAPDSSALANVGVGAIVEVSSTLPSESTKTLGATIKFCQIGEASETKYYIEYTGINTLPTPTLYGKVFVGWYDNAEFNGNPISEVATTMTLYAKYEREQKIVTTETILNAVSDYVDSNTEDDLISENNDARFTWSSSDTNLYSVDGGKGTTSRVYQTHKKQSVTVTCVITYKTGGTKTVSKNVVINPVTFDELPSTPIATYFSTGAASSYKYYSTRYKTEKVFFSEKAKEALDILYYSSITPTTSGTCKPYTTEYVSECNALKAYNVRVIGVIDGVSSSSSQVFAECCSTDAKAADFAKRLMDTVEANNWDGLDIDWEYISSSPITAAAYGRLLRALRKEMAARQDEGGTPYMLTAALPASSWGIDSSRYSFSDLNTYLDYINIMSYDGNKSDVASHLAAFYTSSYDKGWGFGAVYGVNQFAKNGISKSKLLIGCAGYGKAYKVTGTASNSKYPGLGAKATLIQISEYAGKGSFASGTLYGNVLDALEANSKFTKYIEYNAAGQYVGSYLYNATDKIFATYDSSETITAKYEYADQVEGMGLMCWAFTEDMSDHYINTCYECRKK